MYKIFHGFALVEAYQNLKKAKRLAAVSYTHLTLPTILLV